MNHNDCTWTDMAYPKALSPFSPAVIAFHLAPLGTADPKLLPALSIYYSHFAFSPSFSTQETGIEVRDAGGAAQQHIVLTFRRQSFLGLSVESADWGSWDCGDTTITFSSSRTE